MDIETQKELLMRKPLEELYTIRGDQYTNIGELVDDILANDGGAVAEILEREGSFLKILAGQRNVHNSGLKQ